MASADATRQARLRSRQAREQEIVGATRALFDERGMQEAQIEDIARAVGINRALIYRHFASKEELFVMTVTRYLEELAELLAGVDPTLDPEAKMREASERFTGFCLEYPAFPDCALSLMRRPANELRESVSEAVWFRLGQRMAACLGPMAAILREGSELGVFDVADPDFTANHLYTQALGTMHLARLGVGVNEVAPGIPGAFHVTAERVRQTVVQDALAAVRPRDAPGAAGSNPSR